MPVVTKQKPSQTRAKPSPNGSVLSRAIPVDEVEEDFVKLVLYGRNRVGKTTLACEFPKPLLLISFEPGKAGGARSVKRVPGVTFLRIESTADAIELAKELAREETYKTHVLDTVTSLQDLVLRELLGLEAAPVQLNWGTVSQDTYRERSEKTREVMRPFRDLKCHTVFVAQEKDHNPPKQERNVLLRGLQHESFFAADLGGATVKWLHDSCDYVAQLYQDKEVKKIERTVSIGGKTQKKVEEIETGRVVRRLRTMYHPNFAAGFRSEDPTKVPEYVEAATPKQMYDKMMAVIRGD